MSWLESRSKLPPLDPDNPQTALDWLYQETQCELCGKNHLFDGALDRSWRTVIIKKNGYTSKHSKFWRICKPCLFALNDLMDVQPMNQPNGHVMYMDLVYGPYGPVTPAANPCGEQVIHEDPCRVRGGVYRHVVDECER